MPAIKKADSDIKYGGGAIVVPGLKSHDNDPFVIKKNEEAKIAVKKLALPGTNQK